MTHASSAIQFLGAIVVAGFVLAAPSHGIQNYPNFMTADLLWTDVSEETTTPGDPEPLFGAPAFVSGNSLIWQPTGFVSTAQNGATDQTASTYRATVESKNKDVDVMTGVMLTELGDFSLTGSGTDATTASVMAALSVSVVEVNQGGTLVDLSAAPIVLIDSFSLSYDTPPQGANWSGSVTLDIQAAVSAMLPGAFATKVTAIFTNELETESEAGTTSLIQKKTAVQSVQLTIIPEPSTAALLGLGILAFAVPRARA